jgi:hypothetical protein
MEKKEKIYSSAPLPFQGQKRRHIKEFTRVVEVLQPDVVVDLFGGSGLLSHFAKHASPNSRVIYNDYDNYCERLAHIPQTNELLRYFRELLRDCKDNEKITGSMREAVLQKLAEENAKGYVDWLTMSVALKFSMKYAKSYAEFVKEALYSKIRMFDYTADGYLDGLEIVRTDYRELCRQYRDTPRTLFIADPPYLSTDVKTYNSVEYWKMGDYLDILTALNGLNFVYFTSEKSQIVELCEWIDENEGKVRNIFKGASMSAIKSPTSGTNSYTDIMLHKLKAV